MAKKTKATIHDIARLAGVGVGTVSRVLNGHPSVSAETEAIVRKAIEALGYRPAAAAQTLRTRRSNVIGFITDEIATSPHAGQIMRGAQEAAWKGGKLLFLVNTQWDPELERAAIETMIDRQVDGLIYATMYHRLATPPSAIRQLPTVLLDCFVADASLPSVVPDEVDGAFQAVHLLIQRGHRRIGFINHTETIPAQRLRMQGYCAALAANGIAFDAALTIERVAEPKGGYDGMQALLSLAEPPSAVFCFNDRLAMGAYDAIRQRGLRIPQDIAVIGFDNQELIAANLHPGLTTMQLPHYEMGIWAVEYLMAELDAANSSADESVRSPPQVLLKCPLVLRDSV
ncbi:MAG TPA: substrate-binding domain-containing protein [Chloroflexi bacterium]|nr:substrate-binding domain-containing protein [Chloroflexota bacterium]